MNKAPKSKVNKRPDPVVLAKPKARSTITTPKKAAAAKPPPTPPPQKNDLDSEEEEERNFGSVLDATKRIMDQLSAVYPELGPKRNDVEQPKADGSIVRAVKPLDMEGLIDEAAAPMGERDLRDETAEKPDPNNKGMLSWLGQGSDGQRGLVSSDAIGERDLLGLLEGITVSPRGVSTPDLPTGKDDSKKNKPRAQSDVELPAAVEEEPEPEEEAKIQDFTVECGLGTGGFAAVVLVEHNKTGKIYAVKTILKSRITREKQIQRIGTERRVLQEASDHPFIARMHFAFQNHRQLFFILDFCAGGDLYYHLTRMKNSRFKHFSEEATQFYVAELVLALEHLHQRGIVYRDLKLENVMLDEEGHVKLVDFGLSKENVQVPCEEPLSPCGSILYMAPELLEMTGGTSVDWWTLGILMHEMLTGRSPWKSETQNAVLSELRGKAPVKLSKELSSRGAAIISALVTRNPRKRLGTRGASEIKSNPFFWPRLKQQSDWKKLLNKNLPPPIRPCKTKISAPAKPKPAGRGTGPRASGELSTSDAEAAQAKAIKEKANDQKQFGTQNFEKSQRNLAIKAVAVPDPSDEGSVGYEFEGFVMSEGGPTIKPKDMKMIRQLQQKRI